MTGPGNGHDHTADPAYVEWDQEEVTPVESNTLQRLIRAAVRRELRPIVWCALATAAALIALTAALVVTR